MIAPSSWRRWGRLALLALLTLALGPVVYTAQQGIAPDDLAAFARYKRFTTYDQHFTKYSKRFFGVGFDWHYFKAQAVAESNLREDARSPVGAVGVMPDHAAHLRGDSAQESGDHRVPPPATLEHRSRHLVRPAALRGVGGRPFAG